MYNIDEPIDQTTGAGGDFSPIPAAWYNLVCTHVGGMANPFDGTPQIELCLRVIDGEHKGRRLRRWVTPKFSSGAEGGKKSNLFAVTQACIFKGQAVPGDYKAVPRQLVGTAGMWQVSINGAGDAAKNKVEGVPAPLPAGTVSLPKTDFDEWAQADAAWYEKRMAEGNGFDDVDQNGTAMTHPPYGGLAEEDIPFSPWTPWA